jgi:protein TonB
MSATAPYPGNAAPRYAGFVMAAAMHVAAGWALLQYAPVRQQLMEIAPIMVSLVAPPRPATLPQPATPKPKPEVKKQAVKKDEPTPPPQLAVAETAPAPATVWTSPAQPKPEPAPAAVAAAAPPAPTAPVIPPSYQADYLNNPAPPYPALSRRLGEEGRVVLRVFVDESGAPAQVQIRTSSGHERLDGTALETVHKWKFVPARRGSQAVGAWVLVPISFYLRS